MSVNPELKQDREGLLQTVEQNERYFCYLIIKLQSQTYIGGFLCLVILLLFAKSLLQYYRATKLPTVNLIVRLIYFTIFSWCVLYLVKILYSQYMYLSYDQIELDHQKQEIYGIYSISSKKIFVLDVTCIFLLQAVLILVCYNWFFYYRLRNDNIVRQLKLLTEIGENSPENDDKFSNITDSYHNNMHDSISGPNTSPLSKSKKRKEKSELRWEIISRNLLRVYLVTRFFLYFLVVPFIIQKRQEVQTIIVKIMISLLLVQALLVLIILMIGVALIRNNKKLQQLVNDEDIDLMVNQYSILIICSMIRLVLDVIFIIYNFGLMDNFIQCLPNDLPQNTYAEHIVKFVLQAIFTHFLPIIIVLRIYNVKDKNADLSNSLIIAQQSYQKFQNNPKFKQ